MEIMLSRILDAIRENSRSHTMRNRDNKEMPRGFQKMTPMIYTARAGGEVEGGYLKGKHSHCHQARRKKEKLKQKGCGFGKVHWRENQLRGQAIQKSTIRHFEAGYSWRRAQMGSCFLRRRSCRRTDSRSALPGSDTPCGWRRVELEMHLGLSL